MTKTEVPAQNDSIGGLAFFSSIPALFLISLWGIYVFLWLLPSANLLALFHFAATSLVGFLIAFLLLNGRIAVFVHELKHSIVSNLAGNRAKSMKIDQDSGAFEYKYSKRTAKFNAIIALAPYCLPLFCVPTLAVSILLLGINSAWNAPLFGLAWGADCRLNTKDISPFQTDFSCIRGGYWIGLTYVLLMNLTIFVFSLIWIAYNYNGFVFAFQKLLELILAIIGFNSSAL